MAKNIQIRNVSDEVHEVYKRRAAAAGMSLQEYLLWDLSDRAGRLTMAEAMARIDRHRRGGTVTMEDIVEAIREAATRIDRGRWSAVAAVLVVDAGMETGRPPGWRRTTTDVRLPSLTSRSSP